ncbi:hypothetical protein E4U12_001199 [Claviceps purpurea]|nr:hypothetical protein E4U12_001199 [Claviceps purpurea]
MVVTGYQRGLCIMTLPTMGHFCSRSDMSTTDRFLSCFQFCLQTKQPLHVELGFCQLTLSTTLLSLLWATRFGDGDVATNRDWSPEKSGTGHSGTVRREIQDLATCDGHNHSKVFEAAA